VIKVNPDAVEIIGPERAMRTPLVPIRSEHKVIDYELAPVCEKLGQRLLASGTIEDVLLINLLPREFAPLPVQFVPLPREFLFLRQERCSRGEPLLVRNYRVGFDTVTTIVCHALSSPF
jgi:hypothetical protein